MKVDLLNFSKEIVGEIELKDEIFNCNVSNDNIALTIRWQRLKRMAGTHSVKTVAEVSGSGKKPFAQKGTGRARRGCKRAVQLVKGGISHGPVTRSHEISINKKVKLSALLSALTVQIQSGTLLIVDSFDNVINGTSQVNKKLNEFSKKKILIIDSVDAAQSNFYRSIKNINRATLMNVVGLNVYDIMKHDCILISEQAIPLLNKRLLKL